MAQAASAVKDLLPDYDPENPEALVGFSWDSRHGRREIREVGKNRSDEWCAAVATDDDPFMEILPLRLLERVVLVDTDGHRAAQKAEAALREQEAREAERAREKADLDGFMDDATPIRLGKVREVLSRKVAYRGEFVTRRDLVRSRVREGWTVQEGPEGRRLVAPDGVFLSEKAISKTGMDYAAYLQEIGYGMEARVADVREPAEPADFGLNLSY